MESILQVNSSKTNDSTGTQTNLTRKLAQMLPLLELMMLPMMLHLVSAATGASTTAKVAGITLPAAEAAEAEA